MKKMKDMLYERARKIPTKMWLLATVVPGGFFIATIYLTSLEVYDRINKKGDKNGKKTK